MSRPRPSRRPGRRRTGRQPSARRLNPLGKVNIMQGSYRDNPGLKDTVFELLDLVFPGIREHAAGVAAICDRADSGSMDAHAVSTGGRWEDVSTPFVAIEDGRAVSHVGVIGIPMVLAGREASVASIHAVATHPDRRREGLFRRVMNEALSFCEGCHEVQILTTGHPEYFEPFGFRHIPEHRFRWIPGPSPRPGVRQGGQAGGFRRLDVNEAADVSMLFALLEDRTPVSQIAGVVREKAVFCFNEAHRSLYYSAGLDVVVCLEIQGLTLHLYDIVGRVIPGLGQILGQVPHSADEVLVYFSPDRLMADTGAEPHVLDHDGPSSLMVRGPFPVEGLQFTLPRPART